MRRPGYITVFAACGLRLAACVESRHSDVASAEDVEGSSHASIELPSGVDGLAPTAALGTSAPAIGNEEAEAQNDPVLEPPAPPLVSVTWAGSPELATEALELSFTEASMVAVVSNLTDQAISLGLQLVGDDGTATGTRHVALEPTVLAPFATHPISLSISDLGFALDEQRRSGQVQLAVDARLATGLDRLDPVASAWPSYQRTSSPTLYYHPVNPGAGRVALYGEALLHERFGHGDYDLERDVAPEEGVVYDRILYGGPGVVSERVEEQVDGGTGGAND